MSIKDKLEHLLETKQAIKTAIQGKGQSVSDTDTFRSYADKINAITTGGGGGSDETAKGLIEGTLTQINDTAGSITKVGSYVFYQDRVITNINLPNASQIGTYAFAYAVSLTEISFPKCTLIGSWAFASCSMNFKKIYAPICSIIGSFAFGSCRKLESVIFPNCEIIHGSAFVACSALSSISLPVCKTIGTNAFGNCISLAGEVNLPLCREIWTSAFTGCTSLDNVYIPNCISIGSSAFVACSALSSISLPNVRKMHSNCFWNTAITEFFLPECEVVHGRVFTANTTNVNLPICRGGQSTAFQTYVATTYSLPALITLGSNAFYSASQVQSLSLPLCTWLRSAAVFTNCKSLSALYLGRKCTLDYASTFYSTPMSLSTYLGYFGSIYVRSRDLSWYQSATNWATYSSRITTYEPEEDLLDEIGNSIASGTSLTTTIENCEVGDRLIAGVVANPTFRVDDDWALLADLGQNIGSSAPSNLRIYTKTATSTTESITVAQTTSATSFTRIYTNIVNIKNKTPNLVSELNNLYSVTDDEEVIISKPNSNEMLLFINVIMALSTASGYSLKGDYDYEYTYGQQARLTMIHTTKSQGSQMRVRFITSDANYMGIIGIELV